MRPDKNFASAATAATVVVTHAAASAATAITALLGNSMQKISNNNSETSRMKTSTGMPAPDPPDSGGSRSRCSSTSTTHPQQSAQPQTSSHQTPHQQHQQTPVRRDASSSEHRNEDGDDAKNTFRIGIYGWRKRCLYVLILGLLVMVIVNLALTLWVLKVMEFSSEGMGQLKIVAGGLKLEGTAYVLDSLIASSIRSRRGQPIVLESSRNLTMTTRDERGFRNNLIFLGNDRFECLSNSFKVMDDRGMVLFAANKDEVVVGADLLKVTGQGGTIFTGSVQASVIRAASGHELRLESPTRSLDIRAPAGVNIESRSGDLHALTLNDIRLRSVEGAIRLEAASILMPMLPTALPSSGRPANDAAAAEQQSPPPMQGRHSSSSGGASGAASEIYQLCVCNNGKLFLAASHSVCAAADDAMVCR